MGSRVLVTVNASLPAPRPTVAWKGTDNASFSMGRTTTTFHAKCLEILTIILTRLRPVNGGTTSLKVSRGMRAYLIVQISRNDKYNFVFW